MANSDYIELQGKIDQAVIDNSVVEVTRTYVIDEPLMMERVEDGEYKFHSAKIVGNATMSGVGNGNIIAEFSEGPILTVQSGKGNVIKGLHLKGTGIGDHSRYTPYTALGIDYYHKGGRSGSTGISIDNCVFDQVTVGTITSANGITQNCEMISYSNIRIGRVRHGFAGCQAQEKLNTIKNVQAWEKCETLFRFNTYGEGTPGHWIIDGVNIAGEVDELVYRGSHEYFPLMISNVYAERLIRIGYWQTFLNDTLSNSVIDFRYPEEMGSMPASILDSGGSSGGLNLRDNNIRYYGKPEIPMVFIGKINDVNNNYEGKKINVIPYKQIEGLTNYGSGKVDKSLDALYLDYWNNDYKGISYNGLSSDLPDIYNIGKY